MKCLLIGYSGSQRIVPASKFLTDKYLPFNCTYINYKGDVNKWSTFLAGYLTALTNKHIIFALDDYLISDAIDMEAFNSGKLYLSDEVVCVKLCECTPQEHAEYPVTTQYTIWDREYLIELLGKVENPWQFEIFGSRLFDKKVHHQPCIKYFTNSSISSRWEGVRLEGLKEDDITELKRLGYV